MIIQVCFFLGGCLLIQQLAALPDASWLWPGLLLIGLFAKIRCWPGFFLVLGAVWTSVFATYRLADHLPDNLVGQDLIVKGYVVDLPEQEEDLIRFNFMALEPKGMIPTKLRLTWYNPEQVIKAGQNWQLTVRLKQPHGNFNPGGFDYERWLFVHDIGATGYVRNTPNAVLTSTQPSAINLLGYRQAISDHLDALLPDSPSLAMVKALTIGDGSGLSQQQWEVFRKTGTTHLMVISGSHIGLIAGLVFLLTRKTWARFAVNVWSPQQVAGCAAILAAFFYAGLTGFSIPAQRAALMVATAMAAIILQRNSQPYHVLALALFVVLLVDPLVVLLPGAWLSFVAVALILYVLAGRLKKPGLFRGGLKANWVTSVGLAPLLLGFFQQVSLIAPLANLIAVPVIGLLLVPLALLATLTMFLNTWLAAKFFYPVEIGLQALYGLLEKLADLPFANFTHSEPAWWALLLAFPGIFLLFAPKGMPSRWLGIVMILPILISQVDEIPPASFKLTLLDVGQGLSAVVQTANHVLIYDTGAKFSETSNMGGSVVLPYLRHESIAKVDTLVISHGDNDHIGGVDAIMTKIPVGNLLTSVPNKLANYAAQQCQVGQSWVWDEVKFTVLSPKPGSLSSENDNSCVLQIQAKNGMALMTGDIEADAEAWLVDTYEDALRSDVLIAPHHGSHTSSSPRFLEEVQPKYILFPTGYRNPFGHPHTEVIDRYQKLPADWYTSADAGAIEAHFAESLKVSEWRSLAGHYWNYQPKPRTNTPEDKH